MRRPMFAAIGLLLLSGCNSIGGDMIVRVSGAIPPTSVQSDAPCTLDMIAVDTDERASTRNVEATFDTTMMVMSNPKPKYYYFTAKCGDAAPAYSHEVMVGTRASYSKEFDLGMMSVERP